MSTVVLVGEVDAAGNLLANLIPTVPVDGPVGGVVKTSWE